MRKSVLTSVLAAATLFAIPALAETLTHRVARVTIDVPKGWHSSTDGDVLKLADKDEDVATAFMVIDSGAIGQAAKRAGKELERRIKQIKVTKEEKITVNGMPGAVVEGDGRLEGTDIDWAVLVLDTPNDDKDLLMIAIGEDAKLARHKGEVRYVIEHIQPLK